MCAITPVAQMVGSTRIVSARKIVNPMGDAECAPVEEKRLRRSLVLAALGALQAEVEEQRIFA